MPLDIPKLPRVLRQLEDACKRAPIVYGANCGSSGCERSDARSRQSLDWCGDFESRAEPTSGAAGSYMNFIYKSMNGRVQRAGCLVRQSRRGLDDDVMILAGAWYQSTDTAWSYTLIRNTPDSFEHKTHQK